MRRIKDSWPGGSSQSLDKVRPSHAEGWLSAHGGDRSASSLNRCIEMLRAVFALAVRDRLLPGSPAAGFKYQKRKKPIRKTPTVEEFRAVVADIRAQVYHADSKDSADFVEFIGLAGLGQAEASALTGGRHRLAQRSDRCPTQLGLATGFMSTLCALIGGNRSLATPEDTGFAFTRHPA